MPTPIVDIAGVVPVDIPEGTPQAIRIGRNRDDMHVIGHQAVGRHFNARPASGISEQIEVERIVAVLKESLLAPVAALGDLMGKSRKYEAGEAGHTWSLSVARRGVN